MKTFSTGFLLGFYGVLQIIFFENILKTFSTGFYWVFTGFRKDFCIKCLKYSFLPGFYGVWWCQKIIFSISTGFLRGLVWKCTKSRTLKNTTVYFFFFALRHFCRKRPRIQRKNNLEQEENLNLCCEKRKCNIIDFVEFM